jgi:hypothetical protein
MGFVDELTAAQAAVVAGNLTCVLDPRELTALPAVWLRFDGLAGPVLAGGVAGRSRVLVTVFLVATPVDPQRDLEALEPLLGQVAGIIPPMSDIRAVALALPAGGTPATALSYTHELLIGDTE